MKNQCGVLKCITDKTHGSYCKKHKQKLLIRFKWWLRMLWYDWYIRDKNMSVIIGE